MKKILLLLIVLGGCSSPQKLTKLNLTYVTTPLNIPAIINIKESLTKDFFATQDIKVSYSLAINGSQQLSALASGDVNIVPTMGDTSAIIGLANNADIRIIGVFGRSPKAFKIMTIDPTIRTFSDLKGKIIGGPSGTVLQQLLLEGLLQNNMSVDDITFLSLSVQDSLTSLIKGDIDVALLVGTATSIATQNNARTLLTGEGLVDGTTLIVVNTEFLKNHKNIVKDFLGIHRESVDFITTNPQKTLELVAEELSISTQTVAMMMEEYDFDPTITQKDRKNLEKTQDFLYKEGLIPQKVNLQEKIIFPIN